MTGDLSPPDDYDEQQRAAYRAGVRTAARSLALHAKHLAEGTGDSDDTDADDEERCPKCGGEFIEAFGGETCTDCGHRP